jgi:hypothetical protein
MFLLFQLGSLSKHAGDRAVNGSAAVLAAFGIALSSFSLKQMFSKSSAARKF